MENTQNPSEEPKPAQSAAPDANNERVIAAVAYVPFLVIWAFSVRGNNAFLTFHTKQGILITILCVVLAIISPIISLAIPLIGALISLVLNLGYLYLIIMGAWKAYQGEQWELPIIGKFASQIKL